MSIISLTTDFGLEDPYVGVMHGVIYNINPHANLSDLSHSVQPQKIIQGGFLLATAYRYFPPSTVHLAVVDPGVGTERRAIAINISELGTFVGPDNGLFSFILAYEKARGATMSCHELTNPAYRLPNISATFHGRDIFAPAAAHLSLGVPLYEFGPAVPLDQLITLEVKIPQWEIKEDFKEAKGQVMHIDHFGNIITNLPASLFSELTEKQRSQLKLKLLFGAKSTIKGLNQNYAQNAAQKKWYATSFINLISSSGYLEIASPNGNAAQTLFAHIGGDLRMRIPLS